MATFEDAAEELVLKLRGLEDEVAESDRRLEELRERVVTAKTDVEEDWTDLTDAVESLLDRIRDEGEQLDRQADETLQAVNDAHNALGESATSARNAIGEAAAELDALGQQATAAEQAVEPLVHDGVEEPAHELAERARVLAQELGALVDEARDFLVSEVVPAIEQAAEDLRERCQELHRSLTEESVAPLQQIFDEWTAQLDQLESYVLEQGYATSRQHAQDVVEYAMDECEAASRQRLDELVQVVGLLEGQLRQFATDAERSGRVLTGENGSRLLRELDEAQEAAGRAVSGLDHVRQELAARSFMAG